MKKALIVLLALAVAGGLIAQEVSWSGAVEAGLKIQMGDSFDDPVSFADDDDDDDAVYAEVNLGYDAGDWGLAIGTNAKVNFDGDAGSFAFYNAHGWLKFVEGLITVRAGLIDPGVWTTNGGWVDDNPGGNLSSRGGMRIEVTPIDGLNVGAMFGWPNDGIGKTKVGNFIGETAFGFHYDVDLFYAGAALKLFSEDSTYGGGKSDTALIGGFWFHGLPSMDVGVQVRLDHLTGDADTETWVGANWSWDVTDQLGVYADGGIKMVDGLKLAEIEGGVSFGLTEQVSIGADVTVDLLENADEDFGLAKVAPGAWVKYDLGGGSVKAGYGFTMLTKDYGDSLDHTIKLVFAWSF